LSREHIHFVTGRLAEDALRDVVARVAAVGQFEYTIDVLPISVAALMTPAWVAPRLHVPETATRVLLPGHCQGDLAALSEHVGRPVVTGPKDMRHLPQYFAQADMPPADLAAYDIEILAEINHAPRLSLAQILAEAESLRSAGADWIDVGCDPGDTWSGVAEVVRALREAGHRVSIDSLNPAEISRATRAGAELVLSVNQSNVDMAADWGCEVVAIPESPATLDHLESTLERLAQARVPFRIDPVLEPIGFGFAASLGRYLEARSRWPAASMMMGVGNLTELTEVDSAGVNVLLLAICQELGIQSVLTTQVIPWAQSAVRECDRARRLVYHAVRRRTLPKHLGAGLVMLRDPQVAQFGLAVLDRLAQQIKDHNIRLFVEENQLHLVSANLHLADDDPYALFAALLGQRPGSIDVTHAFYLGYELAKATTALTLGKEYRQDEALNWGLLTRPEPTLHERRLKESIDGSSSSTPREDS